MRLPQSNGELQELEGRNNSQRQLALFLAPQSVSPHNAAMNPISDERKKMMRDLFYELGQIPLVAERIGYRPRTVQGYLREMGVIGRKVGIIFRAPTASQKNQEVVLRMLNEGRTLSDIGDAVGTTGTRVKEFLNSIGIQRDFSPDFSGAKNPNWRGGRLIDQNGYVLLYKPDYPNCNYLGYVREHRYVMEQSLGRLLIPGEVVHHKNRNRQDNRIENLHLYSKNSDHLAEELKGKIPKWTADGLARMKAGVARSAMTRQTRILERKKQDACASL